MRKPYLALAALLALVTHARTAPKIESAGFSRAMTNAERSLENGQLDATFHHLRRALERQPKSVRAWRLRALWARAAEDRDEEVYALHRAVRLGKAQEIDREELAGMETELFGLDPQAERWLGLSEKYIGKLVPLAEKYEKDERRHSAIRVHKEILALDPERAESQAAIERIASAPDPSLAGDAKPKDLLADVSEEFILEHDEKHREWKDRAKLRKENYTTQTNAGYEILVRAAEAMEQMNAFYRIFFQYGTEEHGGNVSRIDLNIFKTRDEYLEMGIGPPVEWSGGHFTGGAVETYIGDGGFEETVGTLFHEAAHQFVSLATSAAGWLNEGLASFFEGCRILPNGTVLMNMPANHRLFPLVTRLEQGWMSDAWDGIDRDDPSAGTPSKAPTFRIVLENEYPWGPPWYAPTWGVVYFLYNYQDPLDGRFVYRKSFGDFINASGGRVGKGAVRNFEEVVLHNPAEPTKGAPTSEDLVLPQTVEELDPVWKEWLIALRDEQSGRLEVDRPYTDWARYAIERGDYQDAAEHFEKGIVATPDDLTLLIDFAELLVEPFEEKDRASKLLRDAARLIELQDPVDEALLKKVEARIVKLDPTEKTISRIHDDLVAEITDIVESYMAEGSNLMAMDVSWRMGNDFGIDAMFEYFREGAMRSKKSLALWKLMYNEENLDGWAASAAEIFAPDAEVIRTSFETFEPDNFDYRFLTLEEITSGDFSMEAEIQANKGKVSFGGIVFGRKSLTDFHALLYHPPSTGGAGLERKARLDLASFFGDTSYKTWRQTQVEQKTGADRSSSGEWHKLRIDVTGSTVDGWIDGDYAFTHEFPSLDQLRGRFGLMVGKGKAAFRNVRYLARTPRDPGSLIERELRMEALGDSAESRNGSWLGMRPPFPEVERWVQGEAEDWSEAGVAPQLLVLWSIDQNELVPIDRWLQKLAKDNEKYGLRIVSIAQAWDARKLSDYLAEHPFPGVVGVDEEPPSGTGPTFQTFGVERFGLPRLVLLDIDGKVAWEGDPGFKAGQPYDPSLEGYLEAPLDDLLKRRRLLELVAWRDQWQSVALPAIAEGDVPTAIPLMLESMEFDWRIDDLVLDAQRRKKALEQALTSLDSTVEAIVAAGQEPALAVLVEWAEHFELEKNPAKNRALKKALKAKNAKDWQKAVGVVNATMKKVDAGKEVAVEEMLRRLSVLDGPLAETLRQELEAGATDPIAVEATLRSAERLPTMWLIEEYFGWKE